jgi:cyanophycinase
MRKLPGVLVGALMFGSWGCVDGDMSLAGDDSAGPTAVATGEARPAQAKQAYAWPNRSRATPVGRKLLIIGTQTDRLVGTVTDDAIFIDRLITDVGGQEKLKILVVSAASSAPNWLYSYFQAILPTRGVPLANLTLARIASRDDESTPHVDESTWSNGAYAPSEVAKVADANVIWFEGGDQSRLVNLLLDTDGHDSPFQAAIKAKLADNDLIIAGYSAGAAAQSDPMIGNGSGWGALVNPPDLSAVAGVAANPCGDYDTVCITRGLGYLPSQYHTIIDQHFTQRGRYPRLVRAMAATNLANGWGVSEFSAFYVDLLAGKAEVVGVPGKAFVTLLGRESATANAEQIGPPFLGENYTMSILGVGDTYTLPTRSHPHGVASHPVASEYYQPFDEYYSDNPVITNALGYQVLIEDVATYFADGAPQASGARVDAVAFKVDEAGVGSGFRFRFTADAHSRVAWNEDAGYAVFDARWKISTITAQISGLGP